MSRVTRTTTAVLLAALVVLAGCSGGGGGLSQSASDGGDGGSADVAESGGSNGGSGAEATASASGDRAAQTGEEASTSSSQFAASRIRIRLGTVNLRVDDYESSRGNLTDAAQAYGGFVSDSSEQVHERDNETWTTGTLVVRIPKENFSGMMDDARAEGRVDSTDTRTKDVTEQVVDTRARLTSLRAERDRLRELYNSSNTTESVLKVQERLSEVQSEIERLQGRLRTLENQVAYSTITINLREEPPEAETQPRPQWYDTPVVTAFLDSVDGVVTTLRAAVVAAAYLAPYALAFGVPVVGAAFVARRRLR